MTNETTPTTAAGGSPLERGVGRLVNEGTGADMQCKDIPDAPVLAFLNNLPVPWTWGTWFWSDDYKPENSVLNVMPPGTPEKLALAKMRRLMQRGLVDGCDCGCRGDFELTPKGRLWLAQASPKTPNV
jgi:hypothetical protein